MAGADEVMAGINRRPGVVYRALVPNVKGAELALAARRRRDRGRGERERDAQPEEREALGRRVARRRRASSSSSRTARASPVEAIVSTAFGCPYEGDVAPERVAQIAGHLLDGGADRLSLRRHHRHGDARAGSHDLLDALERAGITADRVGLHFHNTRGTGLANVVAALERGCDAVRRVDRRARRLPVRARARPATS